jgi:hypothetical protein
MRIAFIVRRPRLRKPSIYATPTHCPYVRLAVSVAAQGIETALPDIDGRQVAKSLCAYQHCRVRPRNDIDVHELFDAIVGELAPAAALLDANKGQPWIRA